MTSAPYEIFHWLRPWVLSQRVQTKTIKQMKFLSKQTQNRWKFVTAIVSFFCANCDVVFQGGLITCVEMWQGGRGKIFSQNSVTLFMDGLCATGYEYPKTAFELKPIRIRISETLLPIFPRFRLLEKVAHYTIVNLLSSEASFQPSVPWLCLWCNCLSLSMV